jgi:hypothetical protein
MVRVQPRVSVSALIDYIQADAIDRTKTVQDCKYPPAYRTPYYRAATSTMVNFLAGRLDEAAVVAEMDRLSRVRGPKPWNITKARHNATALARFMGIRDRFNFKGRNIIVPPRGPAIVVVNGVSISVYPELLVTGRNGRGDDIVGGLKMYVRSEEERFLNVDTAAIMGVLLHKYLSDTFPGRTVDLRSCLTADIFGEAVYTSPGFRVRKMQEIEASCGEIRRTWAEI